MDKVKKRNLLVFPGGTEIGQEILNSLKHCKEINLFSAGSDVSNGAPFVFNNHSIVPDIHNKAWLDSLNNVIEKFNIDYVYPAYDDRLMALALKIDEINAKVILSPLDTCIITKY